MAEPVPRLQEDYYVEHGCVVFTEAYLLRRGACCGNGCRHCPYGVSEPHPLDAAMGTANARESSRT